MHQDPRHDTAQHPHRNLVEFLLVQGQLRDSHLQEVSLTPSLALPSCLGLPWLLTGSLTGLATVLDASDQECSLGGPHFF